MRFISTEIEGVFILEPQRLEDSRGFFARTWCRKEFFEHGLDSYLVQCSISFNTYRGTLRGMHVQLPPFAETKVVRCTRGAVFDVIVDLRTDSNTFLNWIGVELSATNRRSLYVPKGFAHGFQALEDETEVFYQISEQYSPEYARGCRWNDPQFNIAWPETVTVISERDKTYEDYNPASFPITSVDV